MIAQTALSFVVIWRCCPAAQATSLRATAQGWFVTATTRSQVLPRAFIDRGDVRACAEHRGLGPNGLKIEKETTHVIVRWPRVVSVK